jgi:hypothetical protein
MYSHLLLRRKCAAVSNSNAGTCSVVAEAVQGVVCYTCRPLAPAADSFTRMPIGDAVRLHVLLCTYTS